MKDEKAKKRIAVVIPKYGLPGGAEGFVSALTRRIAGEGFNVHVFANRWSAEDGIVFHKVPIVRVPRFLTQPSFAWFSERATAGQFDLIHAHDRIFRADLFTMHGIPHRIWVREVRNKRLSLFDLAVMAVERELVRSGGCRFFHAVSSLTRDKFLQEYPETDPDRVHVIHPGVEGIGGGLSRSECSSLIRRRFGFGADDLIILFVSMNFDIKGLNALMAALARLNRRRPDISWRLLVAGKGEVARYRKLATSLGLGERVAFSGSVSRDELATFYSGSQIFCMPSKFDTFGMAALEAMASSLPVIISENVGARDLIMPGENGFVVKGVDKEEQICESISLLGDRSLRERMGNAAAKTASSCTWTETSRRIMDLYNLILEEKQKRAL